MSITEQDLTPYTASASLAHGPALILAPHPDDEVFACGGAMIAHREQGDAVQVVLVTDGAMQGASTQVRFEESMLAAQMLGVDTPICWGLPDRGVNYDEALINRIVEAIRETNACIVYAPWTGELHPDHRAIALAAREAVRRVGGTLLLAQYEISAPMRPNCLLDLSGRCERKMAAMQVFASQLAFNRYDEAVAALNRYRAYTLAGQGIDAAEAYFVADAEALAASPSLAVTIAPTLPQSDGDLPRVTVMIRSSNRPTLREALDSISAQIYPHIDVLVVNTTGKPHTETLSCRFPVQLIEAGGVARRPVAANLLLNAAGGDWLIFLDDDDWLLPDHITKLVAAVRSGGALAAYADVGCADAAGNPIPGVFDREFDLLRLHIANFLPIHAVLFSRKFVDQDYRFDEAQDHFEDWDFWLQLARRGEFRHVPGVSAIYRIHNNANSGIHDQRNRLEGRAQFLTKWATQDVAEVSKAVAMRLTEAEDEVSDARHQASELATQLSGRESDLQEVHGRLGQAYADIGRLNAEVAQLDADVEQLEHKLEAEKSQLANVRQQMLEVRQRLEAELAATKQHAANLAAQVEHMHHSLSWRLTSPLRRLGRLARKGVRGWRLLRGAAARSGGWFAMGMRAWGVLRHEGMGGLRRSVHKLRNKNAANTLPPVDSTQSEYERWIAQFHTIDATQVAAMQQEIAAWQTKPLISILMPVYNTPEVWLRRAIESVQKQIYPHWELCIADDASSEAHVKRVLQEFAQGDSRIRVQYRKQNGHISAASNSALTLCQGEFTALFDHDDELPEDALVHVVRAVHANPQADMFYSDEDKIDVNGRRFDPYFKPDWNPDLFLSQNFFSHLGVYRTALLREVGGFREGFEGSQDYDLALRSVDRTGHGKVVHIPRVLYHWRVLPGSTSGSGDAKPYAFLAAVKAVEDHIARQGLDAEVMEAMPGMRMLRVRYRLPQQLPHVTIIIPTRDGRKVLQRCLDSIRTKTTYANYRILVVDNGSRDEETLSILQYAERAGWLDVLRDDRPFNYSALNNNAVRQVESELICLLNDDTEVIAPDWLDEMVSQVLRPGIGAVGAKLLYPDDTVQHAGVIVGLGGVAGHPHTRLPNGAGGYFGRAALQQDLTAVTAACMLLRRSAFLDVGGLNEERLAVAFNDVDLCLKIRESGLRVVWTPYSLLYHHESLSRGSDLVPAQIARFTAEVNWMQDYWGAKLDCDPAYNPNLSLKSGDFSLAWPPREAVGVAATSIG